MKLQKLNAVIVSSCLCSVISLHMIYHFLSLNRSTFQNYFSGIVILSILYWLTFLFSISYLLYQKYELQEVKVARGASSSWLWDIYVGGWIVMIVAILKLIILQFFTMSIAVDFLGYAIVIFVVKGIVLIPLFLRKLASNQDTGILVRWGLIEIALVGVILFAGSVLREVANIDL